MCCCEHRVVWVAISEEFVLCKLKYSWWLRMTIIVLIIIIIIPRHCHTSHKLGCRVYYSAHMIGSLSEIKGKCWEFVLLSMTFGGRLPVGRHSGRGLPWPEPSKKLLVRMWHEKAERGGHGRRARVPNELRENSWDFILIRLCILDSGISVWM